MKKNNIPTPLQPPNNNSNNSNSNNNNNNKSNDGIPSINTSIKYVRQKTYPSTSRNLVETTASQISDKEYLSHIKRDYSSREGGMGRKPSMKERERSLKRQPSSVTGEKKTRWLLTRKTWRMMSDAGRKLIPDGVQNKPENMAKLEEHFQNLCANEKKFLIWKRKLSYPGASGSFRRKNKNKISKRPVTVGSPPTGSSADECEDDRPRGKATDDLIIKMLEKYLSINSDIDESESELNGSSRENTEEKQQQQQQQQRQQQNQLYHPREITREINNNNSNNNNLYNEPSTSSGSRGSVGFNVPSTSTSTSTALMSGENVTDMYDTSKSNVQDHSIWHPGNYNESIHTSLLLDSLKQYRKKNYSPYIESDSISTDLLKDKVLLRKILNDIRTQQKYSKSIPRTESTRSLNISYSSSMSSLTSTISSTFHNFVDFIDNKASSCRNTLSKHDPALTSSMASSSRDMLRQNKDPYNKSGVDYFDTSTTSSSASRAAYSPSSITQTHQIYNQQKQIFATKQQQQLYHHQQQHYQKQQQLFQQQQHQQQYQNYPSNLRTLNTHKASTMLKTITTKTTSTSTTTSTSKSSLDSSSPTTPTSPPGILKNSTAQLAARKAAQVKTYRSGEVQTDGIPLSRLNLLFDEYKKMVEEERQEEEDAQGDGNRGARKLSIDNKDVSQSVSDTIKRYLMMARKKPKNNDDANRFKRVNYDRNLRNIKAKGEITKPGDDDGLMKGCQTDSNWLEVLYGNESELNRLCTSPIYSPIVSSPETKSPPSISPSPSLPSSPPSPSTSGGGGLIQSSTQFLSNLLWHHSNNSNNQLNSTNSSPSSSSMTTATMVADSSAIAMQKSKSSSNVGHLVSKKIFRSRSKSQTRGQSVIQPLTPASPNTKPQWTPQGNCIWVTNNGKRVQLRDVFVPNLTEVERVVLEKTASEKILQLGITVLPYAASQAPQKPPKRRVLLLKRKAVTTGFFDSKGKEDYATKGGLVFNLLLENCIENDVNRLSSSKGTNKESRSNRSSLTSLLDHQRDPNGSCESLPTKTDIDYLNSTFLPLYHTNIDRRSSQDDDTLSINLPGVQRSQLKFQVPSIVLACTKYLEEYGLNTVGIFRVSTSKKRVRQLREDFDKGTVTQIDPDVCPHDIATLLKEFFRDLPEPLLCRHLYKGFLQTQSIRNRRLQLEGISFMIHLLPVAHRDTLYVLLKFLAKVARAANDTKTYDGQVLSFGNKMDTTNLATIIAPNILHCIKSEQFEEQEIAERADVINIIRIMIDHYEDLFIVSSEDMNEIYTNMMDIYPLQLDYLLDRLYIRQEEDIDSGSSIPPLSPPYTTHHTVFSDDEKIFSPTSVTATTTVSTVEMPKKVVYSREDLLHENAAKGGLSARRLKEREVKARMKFQDPEKPARRRKQSDRTESGDLSSSSSTHESYQHSSGISVRSDYYIQTISSATDVNKTRSSSIDSNASSDVFEIGNRRMSSPLASSHSAGVVTASLKIPVQLQTSSQSAGNQSIGQNIQFYLQEKSTKPHHNIGDNITDIPFIEENSPSIEYPENYPRRSSQSIFTTPRQSVTVTTKRLDEIQMVNVPQSMSSLSSTSMKDQASLTSSSSGLTKIPSKKLISDVKKPLGLSKSISLSSTVGHISSISSPAKTVRESNYTPSITNIGSNVLRSKTADFERIVDQNKKSRTITPITIQSLQSSNATSAVSSSSSKQQLPSSQNVTNINISLKTTTASKKKGTDEVAEKRAPVYKRQEIISSVQKSVKK